MSVLTKVCKREAVTKKANTGLGMEASPAIPALERLEAGGLPLLQSQPGLHSEFKVSPVYVARPCLKERAGARGGRERETTVGLTQDDFSTDVRELRADRRA